MNHPKREEWVPYLYGETRPDVRRHLKAHLQECSECREEIQNWKQSLGRLDAWKLPSTRSTSDLFAPLLRLAFAAIVVLGVGFAAGRWSATGATAEKVRAAVEPQLRKELVQLAREEAGRATAATLAAANEQSERIAAAYSQALWFSLKKDVDVLAVNVDAGLRNTTQELIQLIDYKKPDSSGETPAN
jgi:hypothetical protein